jgi:UDP-N-acetylmuramate dehydrogenase
MQHFKNQLIDNTFKINCEVKDLYFPETIDNLTSSLLQNGVILGGCSNVILPPTLNKVISLKYFNNFLFIEGEHLIVNSGMSTNKLVKVTTDNCLQGLESLIGIPGLIGGAIVMNAGSGGVDIANTIEWVKTVNLKGDIKQYSNNKLTFSRRYSILQDKKEIVIQAQFKLKRVKSSDIILQNAKKYLDFRKTITTNPSVGGIFKNWHALKPFKEQLIGLTYKNLRVSNNINIIEAIGLTTQDDFKEFVNIIQSIVKVPLELEVKLI